MIYVRVFCLCSYWSFIAASLAFRSLTHFEIIFVYNVREYSHFKVHENMLTIANYQRNAKQNYNKVLPYTNQNDHH